MNNFCRAVSASILVLLITASAGAMSVVPRNFDQLVARADTVFKGIVVQQRCVWKGEGETRRIMTLVTFRVDETYKGKAVATQVIELLGGIVDDQGLDVPGMPTFSIGESYVLFVVNNGRQICPFVGIQQGLFRVKREQGTNAERIYTSELEPVRDTAELDKVNATGASLSNRPLSLGAKAITATEFRDQIVQKVSEQRARQDAGTPR